MIKRRLFPELPVVRAVSNRVSSDRQMFEHTLFVCVQHLLESTGSLIESLLALGVNRQNVFVLGKIYSLNSSVLARLRRLGVGITDSTVPNGGGSYRNTFAADVDSLWAAARRHAEHGAVRDIRQIVILDDGGQAIRRAPAWARSAWPIAGVEQTTSGLRMSPHIPVVAVATSAAKRYIEPPLIVEAVLSRIAPILRTQGSVGVVGFGNIGRALAATLLERGWPVLIHDSDPHCASFLTPGASWCRSAQEIFNDADCILGCTGNDIAANVDFEKIHGRRTLISCSSGDSEFESLLAARKDPVKSRRQLMADVKICTGRARLRIVRGGFPANFDGSEESVPTNKIQITRALMLIGAWQAMQVARDKRSDPRHHGVSAVAQSFVVSEWLRSCAEMRSYYSPQLLERFGEVDWIRKHSLWEQDGAA